MSPSGRVPEPTRLVLERRLRALVLERSRALGADEPVPLPTLGWDRASEEDAIWFPVPGMYGGFKVWNDDDGLIVESWSRIVGGSGQRHRLTETGTELVDEGFV